MGPKSHSQIFKIRSEFFTMIYFEYGFSSLNFSQILLTSPIYPNPISFFFSFIRLQAGVFKQTNKPE